MIGENAWRKRITIDAAIHHGDPCTTGTRVPVSVIVGSFADGDSVDQVLLPQESRAGYARLAETLLASACSTARKGHHRRYSKRRSCAYGVAEDKSNDRRSGACKGLRNISRAMFKQWHDSALRSPEEKPRHFCRGCHG